jgi:hypothetical protein
MSLKLPFTVDPPVGERAPKPRHAYGHERLNDDEKAAAEWSSVTEQQAEWACQTAAAAWNLLIVVIFVGLLVNGPAVASVLLEIVGRMGGASK